MSNLHREMVIQTWTVRFALVCAFAFAVNWAYLRFFDPDPLIVTYSASGDQSTCDNRLFPLTRLVTSDRPLYVQVKEYWSEVDGMMTVNGVLQETGTEFPHKVITQYPMQAVKNQPFSFPKAVPKALGVGRYMYRPVAEYRINDYKVITKELPVQYVNVVCEYDPVEHGVMD